MFFLASRDTLTRIKLRAKYFRKFHSGYSFAEISNIFNENESYEYFRWSYACKIPAYIRAHRRYFSQYGRGFGEDAMHAMWWKILLEFNPITMLEIGVYRGQTISLWSLISKTENRAKSEIWGLTPLINAGDSVSSYCSLDYRSDIEANHNAFKLPTPNLVETFSYQKEGIEFVSQKVWDLIYIDGSHELDVVRKDVALASDNLKNGGILVIDDASLYSGYKPSKISFAGHPGPSVVATEIENNREFSRIGTCGHNRIYMKSLL